MKRQNGEIIQRKYRVLAGGAIVLAALAAYHNSFSGPFIFDDVDAIRDNPTIRHLWPIWTALSPPPGGLTVSGRPALNFTLAINYAISGTNVWSYHAVNLLIHILGGLTLFGIMRRTLERGSELPPTRSMDGADQRVRGNALHPNTFLAFAVALLWTVHPLQTESVTYIVQRAESLMGLFYLLTLYCFIRSVDQNFEIRNSKFEICSVLACLLGMATKEVMVSAPVIVFLYDRTFVSGTFRAAWRRHRRLHLGLAATWLLLAFLVVSNHDRGGTAGSASGISWWWYVPTQIPAVVNYLRLAVWPHPLVFDYATEWVASPRSIAPQAAIVALLIAGTLWALFGKFRNPKSEFRNLSGFAGVWFFAILAPTSLVAGGRQTMAEHRMYLALAPVIAVVVVGIDALGKRGMGFQPMSSRGHGRDARATFIAFIAVALACIFLTARRNEFYRSDLSLWGDTAAKRPGNAFALTNLGAAWFATGRAAEAAALYEKSLRLDPFEYQAEYNLGLVFVSEGRPADAMSHYRRAIELKPDLYKARNNLGVLLTEAGRLPEAIDQLEEALRTKPDFAQGHIDLGIALAAAGRTTEAIDQYELALQFDPASIEARSNLGNALRQAGRLPEAVAYYEQALRLKPDFAEVHNNLGIAYSEMGASQRAIEQYEQAVKLKPGFADAHKNLGTALAQVNMLLGAADQFGEAVRLTPGDAAAHNALGGVLFQLGRSSEAIAQYQEALRLDPADPEVCANLGVALADSGRMPEAIQELTRAVELKPNYAEAQSNLAVTLAASGRLAEAIFHYEAALRVQPGNAEIHHNFAAALQQAGRTEEADAQSAEAARLEGKQ